MPQGRFSLADIAAPAPAGKGAFSLDAIEPVADETTHLSPADEQKFQAWAKSNRLADVDHPDSHYDYRGFWQATSGAPHPPGSQLHFPDTFKQHGHPTFSVESKYSAGPNDGGHWDGDTFVPPNPAAPTGDEAAVVAASPAARAAQPSVFAPPAPPNPETLSPSTPVATRGRFTGLPVPDVTSRTPNPVVEGTIQMARGAQVLFTPPSKRGPVAEPDAQSLALETASGNTAVTPQQLDAAADVLEGAMKVGSPLVIAGALADLPATVVGLGASYAASAAAGRVAEQAGASPEAQRFTRALAGAATAVLSGREVIESAKTNTSAMARALTLAAQLSGKTVGEARPVGVGTVAEAAAETQPTAHAPIAAATAKLRDLPTDVGETFGELVDTARAPEPPELRFAQGPDRAAGLAATPVEGQGAFKLADITPVDAAGRALGGYAGPERRGENAGPPTGVDERRGAVIARVAQKLAAGEPLGTDEARAAFAERQRVDAARGAFNVEDIEEPHAVQEPSGTAVDVRQQAGDGEAVGGGDAEHQGAAGASPPEAITPQQAALGALSTGDLHALVDHPETPEPLAHEAVSELMAREEEPTHVPVVRWRANPADQDTKSLKTELQALNEKPGRTTGLSPDADPVFSDDERARYNAIQAELAKRKNQPASRQAAAPATDEGPTPPKFNKRQLNDAFAAALQPFKGSDGRWYFVDRRQPNFAQVNRLDEDKFPATVRGFYPGAGYYHDAIPNVTFEGTYEELPGYKYPTSPTKAEHEAAREQPTSYVLPSFVTAGHAKPKPPKQAIPTTEPLVLAQAEAAMQAATHVQVNKQWQPFGGAQKYHATNNIHNRFSRPDPEALWHIEKVALKREPGRTVVAVTVRTYDSTSGKPQAAQGDTYRFQVPNDFTLPTTAEGRKVEEAAHAEGPVPQSDRGALAGAPAEDGQGARAEGAPESGRGARGAADVGSGSESHPAGRVADAGAGADAGAVGVPPERGGRSDTPERRARDLAAEAADFRIDETTELATGGAQTRIAANLAAIETLKRIEGENRAATPDEQRILAKYVGWGGLPQAFQPANPAYEKLKAALTDEEYRSARASTPNAHYTSPTVIRAVYDALARLGVQGPTRFLEPAAGVGHFLGLMPPELAAQSTRHAVELDAISGRITRALYPNAKVQVTGFERAKLPDGHFDLVVSNVPFGNYQVADRAFKNRPKVLTSSIHNYYFAKGLDLVRPGGLVAFITSHYTLDAQSPLVRSFLADHANLVGAIRLPNTAFKGNAGTEVVTDLILLQKRGDGIPAGNRDWVQTEAIEGGHHVNRYFLEHPEQVLGTHATTGSMYSGNEYTVEPSGDLAEQLRAAVAQLPQGIYTRPTTTATEATAANLLPSTSVPTGVKPGAWFEQNGRLYTNEQGTPVEHKLAPPDAARVRGLMKIRDTLRETMKTMLDPAASDADVKRLQRTLDKTYDAFVRTHGYLARPKNVRALREDPDQYTLLALEEWAPKAEQPEKAAIFTKRTLKPATPVEHVDTPKEALLVSLNETGRVDWARMAELTGQSEHDLQLALEGLVFHDPETQTWEQADRYLSGNVKAKLKAAEQAASTSAQYTRNVEALKEVQPADLEPSDISIRLGAPWVPADVIESFASHLGLNGLSFRYSPALAKWTADDRRFSSRYQLANTEQWGTQRRPANDLLLTTLNLGTAIVHDTVRNPDGSESSVVNQEATIAAREKQQAQQEEFKAWVWSDGDRARRLARLYNDTMNTMRRWEPDGSHLSLPGMSSGVTLRPHQKNFIWRGLQAAFALAHHVVGAGKTYAGIALALEKRRLGLARKPMVVVPNHLPQQWARDVLKLYPGARVLASTKRDFEPQHRKRFLSRIATGDWDVVILPYTHFGMVRVSDETFNAFLQREIDSYEEELIRARQEVGKKGPSIKELEKAKANLEAKLRTAKEDQRKDEDALTWEELGVDMLIVDEAHNYKKLQFATKMTRVAGVPKQGSQRAFDLNIKLQHTATTNPTGGAVFLTGTPISNTMAEMYVLMKYLARPLLEARGIPQFDGWAATFGETVTAFEISPTGRGFRQKTRFNRFTNMPELIQMYRSFADVQTADMLKLPTPPLRNGKPTVHVVPATTELNDYVESLLARYEAVLGTNGKRKVDPRIDNPLKITGDGRKAALDLRLVGIHQPEGGKVDRAARQIHDLWQREAKRKGTQLVFSDLGTPKDKEDAGGFTVYDALRAALVDLGIPREQIAFIHEAKTQAQKQALFDRVNAGDVRVLMGSTERMGAGTNVQQRLVALHHLDAPWRPSDIEQREGRGLRQGNLFGDKELGSKEYDPAFEFEIHTYVSEKSFDAYLWQLLESKARFIMQALKGDLTQREMDDADDIVLTFGEVKALSTGNPAIMEHAKAQSDLARLDVSESNYQKRRFRLQNQLAVLPEAIGGWEHKERDAQALLDAVTALPNGPKDLTLTQPDGTVLRAEDAIEPIHAALERSGRTILSSDKFHAVTKPVTVGTVAGVEVRVHTSINRVAEPPVTTQHWTIATGDHELSKSATIGSGAMASLYHFLETGPRQALERAQRELTELRKSLDVAQTEVRKPFQHADTMAKLRDRIKTLEQSLNLDAKSKAAEAAAVGAIETTAAEEKADAAAERAADEAEERVLSGDESGTEERGAESASGEIATSTPPTKRGVTLQSTILPGAAEFGEHVVEPALKKAAAVLRENRGDLLQLFAPDTLTPHAGRGAGILRANLAARAQRTRRASLLLHDIEKAMDGWSTEQSKEFWDVMEGEQPASVLDADTRVIAERYREILDRKRDELLTRNLLGNYLEHYWGHEWQRGATPLEAIVRRLLGRRPLAGPESFRKRRTIPTMRQGIDEFGLQPVSWNPTTQLLRKLLEMDKSIAAHDIRLELKAAKLARFVPEGKKRPDGWVFFPDTAFKPVYGPNTFQTVTGEEAKIPFGRLVAGRYAGPPEVVRLVTNYLSPGLRGKSALFDLYRTLGNFLNQLQLSFSWFHAMMTGMESVVSKQALVFEQLARGQFGAAAHAQVRVPVAPIVDFFTGHKNLKAFYAHDAHAGAIDDLIGQVVNAGGGFGWDLFEHTGAPAAFMAALRRAGGAARSGEVGRALGGLATAGLRAIPAAVELSAKPIMEGWVPRLKMAAFLDLAKMELETLGPEPDLDEVRRVLGAAWDSIDNRFGELRYDNLFWNNALKDLGMASVRALGWNIGTVREMFGAPVAQWQQLTGGGGLGKPPTRLVNTGRAHGVPTYAPQPETRLHRKTAWFVAMVLVYGLAGAIYQYLRTGKRPAELKDYFFPKNGKLDANGRPERESIAGYFKDLYAATHNLPGSLVETASRKLHPLLTLLYDILTNEDFFGNEIRDRDDAYVQQVKDVLRFMWQESKPISVQQKSVEGYFGVTKAPASVTRTPLEQYLHDIAPPTHRTKLQAEQATEKRALREAVREGTAKGQVDTSHLTPRQVKNAVVSTHRSPLPAMLKDVGMQQALHAYTIASPEERAEIRATVSKKLPGALASTPREERAALVQAYRAAIQLPVAKKAAGF